MAPRKKNQKPSDETPEVTKEEPVTAASADDAIPADPETPETETVEASDKDDLVADPDAPESPTAEDDSIELAEPAKEDDTLAASDGEDTLAAEDTPKDPWAKDTIADDGDDTVTSSDETPAEPEPTPEPDPTPTPDSSAPATQAPVVVKRGGFFPLLLGGVAAAAVGYVAAMQVYGTTDVSAQLDAQESAIAELRASIPDVPDTTAIEAAASDNAAAISEMSGRVDEVATQLSAMADRMTELEKAPLENGVSDAAIQAYEEELARLQDAMAAQRAEVESMVTRAQEMNAQADAQTARTEARAALTEIMAAFDSGDSYGDALEALKASGQQVPAPIEENVDGIPTLAALRADFPPAARQALAVTRGTGNESVGDFFKTQLGIRSLEPKDGGDPDAVLSRAEAAVAENNLATALDEIAALPEEAQAELSDWTAAAQTRLTTVEAARGLMSDLNSN